MKYSISSLRWLFFCFEEILHNPSFLIRPIWGSKSLECFPHWNDIELFLKPVSFFFKIKFLFCNKKNLFISSMFQIKHAKQTFLKYICGSHINFYINLKQARIWWIQIRVIRECMAAPGEEMIKLISKQNWILM